MGFTQTPHINTQPHTQIKAHTHTHEQCTAHTQVLLHTQIGKNNYLMELCYRKVNRERLL